MADPQRKAVAVSAMARADALRAIGLLDALHALGAYAKEDASYEPTKNRDARRYHVSAAGRDYELIVWQQKWYDTREKKGGGGSIDLTMHLYGETFSRAVVRLGRAVR